VETHERRCVRKSTGTCTRLIAGSLIGLSIIYLILLIPDPASPPPPAGTASPFVWNQDEYWSRLEARFLSARRLDPSALADSIRSGLARTGVLLDSCHSLELQPSSPLLAQVETTVFELGALLGAQTDQLPEFIKVHNRLRTIIKDQSRHWDMNAPEAKSRLYRLLYGARTAVDEIMLQTRPGSIPTLVTADDEPSVTPSSEILGVAIHSGDILVSRGGAPTSSLIARGSDYPGNFSHVALVHVDEATGKVSIVESHIERGVVVSSVEEYMDDTKLRIMVLRLRVDHPALVADPMLPHKAATEALARIRSKHIAYDFELNSADSTGYFCSEVAFDPYRRRGVRLWPGMSTISSAGVRSWLAAFGVTHFETLEPSDLEYDPQLRVVAEWRAPETLYQDHLDNAVIDVMLEGAEAGEKLDYDGYKLPLARVLKGYSMVKNIWGGVGPIPEGMNATTALKNDHFSKRHTAIREHLMKAASEFEKTHEYRPPYWELVKLARVAKEECDRN
jgi:hypothetical protein